MTEVIQVTSTGEERISPKLIDRRRRPTTLKTAPQIEEMWEKHHQIARLLFLGWRNKDIAEQMRVSPSTVSIVRNSPVVQNHLASLQATADGESVDIRKEVQEFLPKCMEVIREVITDDEASARLRVDASFKMLGLGGHVPPKNINMKSLSAHLTGEELAKIQERAMEVGIVDE